MENQINAGDKATQQIEQNSVTQPVQIPEKSKINYLAMTGVIFVCSIVFGFGGYYLGTQKNDTLQNNLRSIPSPTSSITTETSSVTNPTSEPVVTQKPSVTTKTISIPSDWKKYTAEDPDFGVRTTMFMPPGYSFRFTGSEFTIQNDSDATELWDYSSSVYRNNDGVLKNHYDGNSRRVWYEKYLSERQKTDRIIGVKEKPLNATTYLEISVQTSSYDERGITSGTKNGMHYVYVQNNILHMITPVSNKAYTTAAQITSKIETIFVSLTSVQTK